MTEEKKDDDIIIIISCLLSVVDKCHSQLYYVYIAITHSIHSFFFFCFFFFFFSPFCFLYCYRIIGRTLPDVCVFVNKKKPSCWWDEFNTIQSHRYSMCLTPTLTPVFFSSLFLFLFFSTDGSTIEKRKFFFWEKYKQWIRIISSFNNSTWLTVRYSKGVSVYCSLSLSFSRSSLITGSRVRYIEANDRFRSFPLLAERNREKERRRFFLSFTPPIRCHPM
jgi:hypothetical protein